MVFKFMYVCICNAVNEKAVLAAIAEGAMSVQDLQVATGLATDCGKCAVEATRMLHLYANGDSATASPRQLLTIVG